MRTLKHFPGVGLILSGANAGASIVPPSPHISHLASARDLQDRVSETSGEFGGELAKLKKEVARYKRQMVKAEKYSTILQLVDENDKLLNGVNTYSQQYIEENYVR